MKIIIGLLAFVLVGCSNPMTSIDDLVKEYEDFSVLTKEEKEEYPIGRYTHEDFKIRAEFALQMIEKINQFNTSETTLSEEITLELMKYKLQQDVDTYEFKSYLNPIVVDAGFHIGFASRPNWMPTRNKEDYKKYIEALLAFPSYAQQHIDLMREGLALGIAQPKAILDGYEVTYQSHIVDDITKSRFFEPFVNLPESFSQQDKAEIIEQGKKAVKDGAIAGYRLIADFFDKEYLPNAPDEIGVSHWPRGQEYYQVRANHFSTLDLSIDEIHHLGLSEVERIGAAMDEVVEKAGFKGTRREFIEFLRTDEQFYPKTPKELLMTAAFLSKKADGKLPALFGKLPRQPYTVEPVAPHLAPKYTGGRYSGASIHGTRAGEYWVNTYNLPSRPLYVMPSLTLHEAVPGHHLQSAITQELSDLPIFRQNMYISAYGEGWGLYSEYLGIEMGMYDTPYEDFGRLTYEMWRACRLVVDTGIHAFGWTRQQVIDYLADQTALSIHECTTETDRYISWPAQALSYKIGELTIRQLRLKAETKLGDNFDVRTFHDALLSEGTVTLPLLEKVVDVYIEKASE